MKCNIVFDLDYLPVILFGSSLTSRRLLICWRKAFESSEERGDRMFWTLDVDVGDKTRGECRWRLFRVSGGETRRDRAVVVVIVAVVGAEGDDTLSLLLRWWVRNVSSFQCRGTLTPGLTNPRERISPMTDPVFCHRYSPASAFLVLPSNLTRVIKRDIMDNCKKFLYFSQFLDNLILVLIID